MHRRCCLPAAPSVHYTTSCKHSLVLLRMGEIIVRNMLSWLKLLIKLLLLHLVGCFYYCINDARSHKHQIANKVLTTIALLSGQSVRSCDTRCYQLSLRAFQILVPFAKLSLVPVLNRHTWILLTALFWSRSFFGELCHWSGHIHLVGVAVRLETWGFGVLTPAEARNVYLFQTREDDTWEPPILFSRFCFFVCFWRDSPPVGQGLLIHKVSISHSTMHHSR